MAVALGEQRHQHVGAGHFLAARRLHVDRGALDHALEARGRQRLARVLGDDALQAIVDEGFEIVAQAVDVDAAGLEDGNRVVVLGHRQKQVLEGGVFVAAFSGEPEGAVEGSLEVLGQHGHRTTSTERTNYSRSVHSFSRRALERMLVLARVIHRLRHLGLGDLVGVDAAHTHALLMDVQHDLGRFFAVLLEDVLQDVDDELHRRVIVVQHQYLVHRRLLGPGPGERQRPAAALAIALLVVATRRRLRRTARRLIGPAQPVAVKAPFAVVTQRAHRPDHSPQRKPNHHELYRDARGIPLPRPVTGRPQQPRSKLRAGRADMHPAGKLGTAG